MATRDSFLLRTDPELLEALRRWAKDELRSANAQLEYILRAALIKASRLNDPPGGIRPDDPPPDPPPMIDPLPEDPPPPEERHPKWQ